MCALQSQCLSFILDLTLGGAVADAKPFRYRLKPGEAEALRLSPAMSRVVDLSNASQAELNQVEAASYIARTQVRSPRSRLHRSIVLTLCLVGSATKPTLALQRLKWL